MLENYVITNGTIYTETGVIEHGHIEVAHGKIKHVSKGDYQGQLPTIDAQFNHILPGFIDIHIHGGYGEDAMDASAKGLTHLATSLLAEGTTSFLATTMTQSDDNVTQALKVIAQYIDNQDDNSGAEIVGIHLEGPFISEDKVGAQNPKYVQRPSIDKIKYFQQLAQQNIKIITFAPEVAGASDTLSALHDDIIFSIGHTTATFDEVNEAQQLGARHVTHLYNAGTPFEHRQPGLFGAAWTNDQLRTELIVDGIHAHPAAVNIALRQKGIERFYLITDAMRAKGMPDGTYDLGGQDVIVRGSEARLASGALAGSILKMNEGLKNLMSFTQRTLNELWRVTSLNQALALNLAHRKGSIQHGKDADLVIVNSNIEVLTTIKKGTVHEFNK